MISKRDAIIGRIFGISAALAYGISSILIRQGVSGLASPLVGATISLFSGTITLAIVGVRDIKTNLSKKRAIVFLLISGIAAAGGIVSNFFALSLAPVVIVSPLQSTSPIFALFLSALFIKHLEKITPKLIIGSTLVVGGIILITLGKTL